MIDEPDDDLRRAFSALDRTTRATAPAFAELTDAAARNTARRRHRARRASLLIAAVMAPVFFIVRARSAQSFDFERFNAVTGIDPGAVSWQAPSDFLLSVPGHDLLRNVPSIDVHVPAVREDSPRPPDANRTPRRSSDL